MTTLDVNMERSTPSKEMIISPFLKSFATELSLILWIFSPSGVLTSMIPISPCGTTVSIRSVSSRSCELMSCTLPPDPGLCAVEPSPLELLEALRSVADLYWAIRAFLMLAAAVAALLESVSLMREEFLPTVLVDLWGSPIRV